MSASIEALAKRVKKLFSEGFDETVERAPRKVRLVWHGLIDRETGKRWDARTRALVEVEEERPADAGP